MMLLRPSVWLSLSYEAHSSVILIYCCLSLQSTQPEWDTLHCSLSTLLVCAVYTVWDTALFSLHTASLCSLHRLWDTALFSLLTAWQLSLHKPRVTVRHTALSPSPLHTTLSVKNNAFSFHTACLFSVYKQSMGHTAPFSPLLVC